MFSKFTRKITYSMDWFYLRNDEFDIWFKEILRRTLVVDVKYGNFLGLDVVVTGVLAPSFDRCQTTTRTPHMPEAPQSSAETQFQCWSVAVGFYKWGSPSAKRGPGVAHQQSSWRWLENFPGSQQHCQCQLQLRGPALATHMLLSSSHWLPSHFDIVKCDFFQNRPFLIRE